MIIINLLIYELLSNFTTIYSTIISNPFSFLFKFRISNYRNILRSLIGGLFSSLLLIISYLFSTRFNLHNINHLQETIFFAFIVTAFSSELEKLIILYYGFFKKKDFLGPIESIIYALFISIGFTPTTSLLYITNVISPINNILFLCIYGGANLIFAIVLGFFVGLGKSQKNQLINLMIGLFAASFFHGMLNFCLLAEKYILLSLIGIVSIIISIILIVKSLDYEPSVIKDSTFNTI